MNKNIIIISIVVLVVLGGGFFLLSGNQNTSPSNTSSNSSSNIGQEDSPRQIEGYQGNVLAGSITPYIEFNQADFEKAQSEGKIIVLNFYANWCPTCRAEQSNLFEGFNQLNEENVVAFRVNFKDSDTDQVEEGLADTHGIPYQHSKVIIKDGQVVEKFIAESWTADQLISEVNNVL